VACVGSWLQSQRQPKRYRAGCCYALQWEHEAMVGDKYSQVSRLLDKVCQL